MTQSAFEDANPHQSPTNSVQLTYSAPKKVCGGENADMQLAVKYKPWKDSSDVRRSLARCVRCPVTVFDCSQPVSCYNQKSCCDTLQERLTRKVGWHAKRINASPASTSSLLSASESARVVPQLMTRNVAPDFLAASISLRFDGEKGLKMSVIVYWVHLESRLEA